MAPEPEAIIECDANGAFFSGVRGIVEVALFVRVVEVDGGRHEAVLDSQSADNAFDCAGGSEEMAGHGF